MSIYRNPLEKEFVIKRKLPIPWRFLMKKFTEILYILALSIPAMICIVFAIFVIHHYNTLPEQEKPCEAKVHKLYVDAINCGKDSNTEVKAMNEQIIVICTCIKEEQKQ